MVTATRELLIKGGALILLPFFMYAYDPHKSAGLQLKYSITDNIYQLNIKDAGQIMEFSPFFFYDDFLEFNYSGDISLINFNTDNLLLANDIRITKIILLPGVGNKTTFFADLYNFHAPAFDQYRVTSITVGNTLDAYLGNYLLSSEAGVGYKHYPMDSLNDYLEPGLDLGIGVPLPYVIFTPAVGFGFRSYLQEFVSLYTVRSRFYFPLTLDFSVTCEFSFTNASRPQQDHIIPLEYVDDPFFERENIDQRSELQISVTRTVAEKRLFAEARFVLFSKEFYEIENLEREDTGLQVSLQLTKLISHNLALHIKGYSYLNGSTIDDFDYVKDGIELNLELIF